MKNLILFAEFLKEKWSKPLAEQIKSVVDEMQLTVPDELQTVPDLLLQSIIDNKAAEAKSFAKTDLSTVIKYHAAVKMALISFVPKFTTDSTAASVLLLELEKWCTQKLVSCAENFSSPPPGKGFTKEQLLVKLENKNKELNDFSYIISHDLKAPLRAISSLTLWLKSDYGDKFDEEGNQFLALLVERVGKMDKLIDCILKFSRVVNSSEAKVEINLDAQVKMVINNLAPPVTISIQIDSPLPTLVAGENSITQVFQHLIGNAIQFMDKPQGEIHIGCEDEGENWKFYIKDNGPGIEKKYQEKIFEIFQSLQPHEGIEISGMGLTIVKKIVEANEGKVWVESTPGSGAAFYFTWNK